MKYYPTINTLGSILTRPANTTAYAANDSVSDNATAGSVTANTWTTPRTEEPVALQEILLDTNDTGPGTAGAQFRLHLFMADPTLVTGVVGGDNAAWSNKKNGWNGSFTGTMILFSDGSKGVLVPDGPSLRISSVTTLTLWWQLQTLTAFTPSAVSTTFQPRFKGFGVTRI